MSNIVLSEADYKKLINEIKKLREEKSELKKANQFLNDQIKEYNEKFARRDDDTRN